MNFSFIRGILAGLLVGSILAAFVFAYFGLSQKIGIQDPPMGDKTSAAADIEKVVEAHEDAKVEPPQEVLETPQEQDQATHDADAESANVEDANIDDANGGDTASLVHNENVESTQEEDAPLLLKETPEDTKALEEKTANADKAPVEEQALNTLEESSPLAEQESLSDNERARIVQEVEEVLSLEKQSEEQEAEVAPLPTLDEVLPEPLPAIDAFAVQRVETFGQPVMSIVLIDAGNYRLSEDILRAIPVPVSLAVPANDAESFELMQYYRSLGVEVIILLGLPDNLSDEEAVVVVRDAIDAVPQSVGIMEVYPSALWPKEAEFPQTLQLLNETGHGLLFYDSEDQSGQKSARAQGVPSQVIYRNLDKDNGNERAMRRFLDGAAFSAQKTGQSIVVMTPTEASLSALAMWSLQDKARTVLYTSISQALLRQ